MAGFALLLENGETFFLETGQPLMLEEVLIPWVVYADPAGVTVIR